MTLTYQDAVSDYEYYIKNQGLQTNYSLDIAKPLLVPTALDSIEMLENENAKFSDKLAFVQKMLKDNILTVKYNDEVIVTTSVNENMYLDMVEEFRKTPSALRFVVSAIYGEFLKNSLPPMIESH